MKLKKKKHLKKHLKIFGLIIEFRTYGSRIRRFVKHGKTEVNLCSVDIL